MRALLRGAASGRLAAPLAGFGSLGTLGLLLLAGALLAAGLLAGQQTSAYFTGQSSVGGNSFALTRITFTTTANGTPCTADPGAGLDPAPGCSQLLALGSLVPGDRTLGRLQLQNATGAGQARVNVWLDVQPTISGVLDQTPAASGGLGLLVFRCYVQASSFSGTLAAGDVADCATGVSANTPGGLSSSKSLYLLPVYPSASASPCSNAAGPGAPDAAGVARPTLRLAANTALTTSLFDVSPTATDHAIALVLASGTSACAGGNVHTGGQQPVGGPASVAGVAGLGSAQAQGLDVGGSDYLAALAYLPKPLSSTPDLRGASSTLRFTFTAEQAVGP